MDDNECEALQQAQYIYDDVSKWLSFCELKHAGMFAAYIALFIAIMQIQYDIPLWSVALGLISTLVCACINGFSFIPFLNRNKRVVCALRKRISGLRSENLVFYQAIVVQSITLNENGYTDSREDYKTAFLSKFSLTMRECNGLIDNYLDQIVETSLIASIKAYLFDIACRCSILVIAAMIVMIVCIA